MNAGPIPLEAIDSKSGELLVVVDTPRGSPVKFKYDEDLHVFTLVRFLPSGLVFPFDFGFVPGTRAVVELFGLSGHDVSPAFASV